MIQQIPDCEGVIDASPDLVSQWMDDGTAVLIDVREDFEHATERIDPSEHRALSAFDADEIRNAIDAEKVVFYCQTGRRSKDAANGFCRDGEVAFSLAGGIEAWRTSGRSTTRSASAPRLPIMRQVQLTAGFLVALGVALGLVVSPWFFGLSGFVGCGLMLAGATGWCGMAKLFAHMPWNRVAQSCT